MLSNDQLGLFQCAGSKGESKANAFSRTLLFEINCSDSLTDLELEQMAKKFESDVKKETAVNTVSYKKPVELPWHKRPFFALDVETTGLDAAANRVIEIALIPFNMPELTSFSSLISVGESLPKEITSITGIDDDMLKDQPAFAELADKIINLVKKADFLVAYNAKFDKPFVESELARVKKILPDLPWVDPYVFVCELDRFKRGKKLKDSAVRWGVKLTNAHRAAGDALAAGELMLKIGEKIDPYLLTELIKQQTLWQWQNAHATAEYKKSSNWSISR
jgi:DNA polymerase-3 subunit epsilon